MSQQRSDFSRGLGLAALILGVFALLLSWVPIIGLLSLPIALIGLVLGGIGLLAGIKSKSFGIPGAGVFVCVLSFVIQMYTLAPIGSGISAANDSFKSYDRMVSEAEQARR